MTQRNSDGRDTHAAGTRPLTHPAHTHPRARHANTTTQPAKVTQVRKACPQCGSIQPCAAHPLRDPNATRNPRRDLAAHQRWARAIKRRDDYRCQRCGSTSRPEAHHLHGITHDAGVTLCHDCHALADQHVR